MEDKLSKIEEFVYYNSEKKLSVAAAFFLILMWTAFSGFGYLFGSNYGGIVYTISLVALGESLLQIAVITTVFLLKIEPLEKDFLLGALVFSFLTLISLTLSFEFSFTMSNSMLLLIAFPAILVLEELLYFRYIFRLIDKEKFSGKPKKDSAIIAGLLAVVVLGVGRVFLTNITQDMIALLFTIIFFILAACLAVGSVFWLKVYYVRKYGFERRPEIPREE
jgi:hypothetical protein